MVKIVIVKFTAILKINYKFCFIFDEAKYFFLDAPSLPDYFLPR